MTNKTPEINARALPAEAGLISGTLRGPAHALLPKPTNNNTSPVSFMLKLLLRMSNDSYSLEDLLRKYKVLSFD
jgi:hypothetical protein